ncbi:MAG: class I SAM-dependent methyltransferase [Methylovulum sp.]|uniref:class I SAM-dependent methyltransferase n=1 Tax=Methylovulum sp. TaxID=1916980 RepID=UPI00261CBB51|nr:class I SAM-dependent methyltransferase [Methylovulum sp.]MDD2725040.1 class I SAM-dependent methyltransferase [Methylovulum sp.]MDD5124251.1 class I SAM-dependent methyltransferase [Methylovulum sp.]
MNKIVDQESAAALAMSHSPRRIKTLAEGINARTYLEIGVNKGRTFFDVSIPQRTAVDPKFLFDVAAVTDKNASLNETTSDNFFSTLPIATKYDVIFLDGLHTFEQTYRDFCNSLVHSHEQTIFLIDDTIPNDVYSAVPHQKKAVNYRRQAGGKGGRWHGDVYKVIFALHDFHLGMNYRTIVSSGNPQTLVWRSNNGWRKPLFNSLETISRLSYFDLLDHMDILRICEEEEAINLCLNELASK